MQSSKTVTRFVYPVLCKVVVIALCSFLAAADVYGAGSLAFGSGIQSLSGNSGKVSLDLVFEGRIGLAGLQLMVISTSGAIRINNIERGEGIESVSTWGFDYSVTRGGDTLRAVFWSRNGRSLGEATYTNLLHIGVSLVSQESGSLVLKDVQSVLADGQGTSANIVVGAPSTVDITISKQIAAAKTERLSQNFPNPCNPSTLIRYIVPENGHVTLKVYNLLGEEVRTVVDDVVAAGEFEAIFSMEGLPSGVYLYRLSGMGFEEVRKMTLVK